jgi:hypothetical protein
VGALVHAAGDERRVEALHPAVDHALSAFPQPVACQAAAIARTIFEARVCSADLDGWAGSPLTGDGFPFELSFCTADDRLRFTAEPGPSDLDPERRLTVAAELVERLSGDRIPPDVLNALGAIQRGAHLKYGAWIGCRVATEGRAFKLYVEIPDGAQTAAVCQPQLRLPDRTISTRMLAYSPAADSFESYVRVDSLEPRHVPAVLAPVGLESRTAELVDFIAAAYGYAIRGRLPGPSVGVSYITGTPAIPRVTLHFYARALWGSDARIRRQFPRWAGARAWNPDPYLHATAPMAARESWKTFHGLLGITPDREGMSLTIGLRPVSP